MFAAYTVAPPVFAVYVAAAAAAAAAEFHSTGTAQSQTAMNAVVGWGAVPLEKLTWRRIYGGRAIPNVW